VHESMIEVEVEVLEGGAHAAIEEDDALTDG
jgi:hypothetical protein